MGVRSVFRVRAFWMVLLAGVLAAGCRTYGGYGTEEETVEQILAANELFEQDLEEARVGLLTFEEWSARSPALATQAERLRALLYTHEAILAEHQDWAADVAADPGDYRSLNRVLGAILAEQEMIWQRYVELFSETESTYYASFGVPGAHDTTLVVPGDVVPEGRYIITPPFYERIANTLQHPSAQPPGSRWSGTLGNILEREPPAEEAPNVETEPTEPDAEEELELGSPTEEAPGGLQR